MRTSTPFTIAPLSLVLSCVLFATPAAAAPPTHETPNAESSEPSSSEPVANSEAKPSADAARTLAGWTLAGLYDDEVSCVRDGAFGVLGRLWISFRCYDEGSLYSLSTSDLRVAGPIREHENREALRVVRLVHDAHAAFSDASADVQPAAEKCRSGVQRSL